MLRRAVLNLVLNALDVMPQGGTLTVSSSVSPGGTELHSPTGPGLPADVLPRVFEPFFTTKQAGTGLGLAIVARVAEAHGGTAAAANGGVPVSGSRRRGFHFFEVPFPFVCRLIPGGCLMAANSPNSSSIGRVLVVNDHARARESMADVLRQAGHRVHCCSSGAEALQLLQTGHHVPGVGFDCIVTDMMMPGMTGIGMIIQLRQRQCPTQIVMVTAHATVATAVEAMRHGAFDYIEKPFEADALEHLVTQAMRHGRLVNPEPADALSSRDANSHRR